MKYQVKTNTNHKFFSSFEVEGKNIENALLKVRTFLMGNRINPATADIKITEIK